MADLLYKRLEAIDKEVEDTKAELRTTVRELRKNPEDTILVAERNRLVQALVDLNARRKDLEGKLPGAGAGVGTARAGDGGAVAGLGVGSAAGAGAAASLGEGTAMGAVVLERLEQLKQELKLDKLDKLELELKQEFLEIREEIREQSQFVRVLMQGEFRATSSKDSTRYREDAFTYYGYSARPQTVQCMVTGEHMPAASIKAGHIFRQGWNRGHLPLLGVTSVHDPRNIILVRTEVEAAFDRFELAIIPQNENGVVCYQIYVLKKSLLLNAREQFIGTGDAAKSDTKMWKDVHTKYLHVAGNNLPARRLLAFHAHYAIKHAVSNSWLKPGEVTVSQAGWASPGYDSELMRKYLEGAVTSAASEDNQSQ
ncbi:hypothetical protein HYH02_004660 [Chlamydomonas schloesseri]|uniref:HNH nuclease domain-containing protein n=1 Tax=Chlamydomonas schloesseri TaxID=2026947 RepID=A0A835WPX6_9CHLO|nr:hypothetical protein HYH02_004660 [Chlamydomonas schloesseri]|eukprot:KAG2450826.1 hypothetical protein HYH02_004660 [Chlamydomonas schloesseri]